jgi:hypothetical protein
VSSLALAVPWAAASNGGRLLQAAVLAVAARDYSGFPRRAQRPSAAAVLPERSILHAEAVQSGPLEVLENSFFTSDHRVHH